MQEGSIIEKIYQKLNFHPNFINKNMLPIPEREYHPIHKPPYGFAHASPRPFVAGDAFLFINVKRKTILMRKPLIDRTDVKILNILSNVPAMSNKDIAHRIKLSPSTTLERIRKLKSSGIIKKQLSFLDYELLGFTFKVVIRLEVPKKAKLDLEFELQQRHIIAVYSYASPYSQSYYVDAIGFFRTEASIEKLCDQIVSKPYGIKVIGVYKIRKFEKLLPLLLQNNDYFG